MRRDLGPYVYITRPGAETTFHLDGNGTTDAGHSCIEGWNEVVMLPRLSEDETRKAQMILGMAVDESDGSKLVTPLAHDVVSGTDLQHLQMK